MQLVFLLMSRAVALAEVAAVPTPCRLAQGRFHLLLLARSILVPIGSVSISSLALTAASCTLTPQIQLSHPPLYFHPAFSRS